MLRTLIDALGLRLAVDRVALALLPGIAPAAWSFIVALVSVLALVAGALVRCARRGRRGNAGTRLCVAWAHGTMATLLFTALVSVVVWGVAALEAREAGPLEEEGARLDLQEPCVRDPRAPPGQNASWRASWGAGAREAPPPSAPSGP